MPMPNDAILATPGDIKRVLEAALLASQEPLDLKQMQRMFDGLSTDVLRRALDELREDWRERHVELVSVAEGWRFQTRADLQPYLARLRNEKPPRYSRAVHETLAVIAYRQPVTRGDIEDIRGVAVAAPILRTLEERGWIESVGHREVPGRPTLFATTARFLSDLNLRSLEELPPLAELGQLVVAEGTAPDETQAGSEATMDDATMDDATASETRADEERIHEAAPAL
jgi:segregation and condensation protein B